MNNLLLRNILFVIIGNSSEIIAMSPYVSFELTKTEVSLILSNPEQEWVYVPLDINEIFQIIYPNQEMVSIDKFETVQNKVRSLLINKNLVDSLNIGLLKKIKRFQKDLISGKTTLVIQKQFGENSNFLALLKIF